MMNNNYKKHIVDLDRTNDDMSGRHDRICLDRNEMVSSFSEMTMKDINSIITSSVISHYSDTSSLIQKISFINNVPEEKVLLTAGSDAGIRKIFEGFVFPGDKVIVTRPTYAMYEVYCKLFQATPISIEYDSSFALDIERIKEMLMSQKIKMLALANPNQPTGTILDPEILENIVDTAARNNVIVLLDEAYFPFYESMAIRLIEKYNNIFIVRSFSKAYGLAGLRIGYMVSDSENIRYLNNLKGLHEINAVSANICEYILDNDDIVQNRIRNVEKGREVLLDFAKKYSFKTPKCYANFQLIILPNEIDARVVANKSIETGYIIKGGFDFPGMKNALRVSVDNANIMNGFIDNLKKIIDEYK